MNFCAFTFIYYIIRRYIAEVPLYLLITGKCSGKNLPGVPCWETNLCLPDSKPAHYHLSYVAPY